MTVDVTQRAEHAQRLLQDELFKEALATIRDEFVQALIQAPIRDADGIRNIKIMISLLDKIPAFFQGVIECGQLHQHELQALRRGQI